MTATTIVDDKTGTPRERLRAATRGIEAARRQAETADKAASLASEIVQRASLKCKSFRDLDKRIHEFRVDAVRSGSDTELPKDLKAQQRTRVEADDELESALAINKTLGAEAIDALRGVERAQAEVNEAAAGVVFARAQEAARELAELNRRRHVLRLLLGELTMVVRSPMGTGDIAAALVDEPIALPMDQSPRTTAADFWRRQTASLIADPESILEPLPDKKALWGY